MKNKSAEIILRYNFSTTKYKTKGKNSLDDIVYFYIKHIDIQYYKNIEDIWTRFVKEDLGIERYDDNLHIEISAVKSIIPKSTSEYACLYLTESTFNMRLDQRSEEHTSELSHVT